MIFITDGNPTTYNLYMQDTSVSGGLGNGYGGSSTSLVVQDSLQAAIPKSSLLRLNGTTILGVGIGGNINDVNINQVVDKRFNATTFNDFDAVVDELLDFV